MNCCARSSAMTFVWLFSQFMRLLIEPNFWAESPFAQKLGSIRRIFWAKPVYREKGSSYGYCNAGRQGHSSQQMFLPVEEVCSVLTPRSLFDSSKRTCVESRKGPQAIPPTLKMPHNL